MPGPKRRKQTSKYHARNAYACDRCLIIVERNDDHPGDCPGSVSRFDSKAEARHYVRLLMMQRAGEISNLRRQVRFGIFAGGKRVAHYLADFVYTDREGRERVIDVKGFDKETARLKRKLVEAEHGITIELIDRNGRPKR